MTMALLPPPDPMRQIRFHERLVVARKTWLIDALNVTLGRVDPCKVKAEITVYAALDAQRILAASGIRDEHVFPTPTILEDQPTLVGYYRLLVGVPKKGFYAKGTGMSTFKSMEEKGKLSNQQQAALPQFCQAMGVSLAELVRQITPTISSQDVHELPLLTLGQFFQGGNNNTIGQAAISAVFSAIGGIVGGFVINRGPSTLVLSTSAGHYQITFGSDPDIEIQEINGSGVSLRKLLAIEVKGGTDASIVYNRGGEAEKSHLKAQRKGYPECWTVINIKGSDFPTLKVGSPTTNVWFDTTEVIAQKGADWDDFSDRIRSLVGAQ